MTGILHDLRHAVRQLRRSPGFAVVAIGTLALGIGAATAIFSVAHAVLFRPLPFPDSDRLVHVWESHPDRGVDRNNVSTGNFMDWRDETTAFEDLAWYSFDDGVTLGGPGEDPVPVGARRGSPALFRILGVEAVHGTIPTEAEVAAGGPAVLLGQELWQTRFGGDPNVVGRMIQLDESPMAVLGVLPAEVDVPGLEADLWFPAAFDEADRQVRDSRQWRVIGRLTPEATLEQAQAEMDLLSDRIRRQHPEMMEGWEARVALLRTDMVGEVRPLLLVMLGLAAVVLLVACGNLTNLLVARGMERSGEIAVRGALGADRGRLVRQLLTENGVIAAIGGVAGIALTLPATSALMALAPPDVPLLDRTRVDGTVVMAGVIAALLCSLVFGVLPAVRAAGRRGSLALASSRGGTPGRGERIVRRSLVTAQMALCFLLLVSAGLLLRSFAQLQSVDHGFDTRGVAAVSLDLPGSRYQNADAHLDFYGTLLERLQALPGVESAAGTAEPPVVGFNLMWSPLLENRPRPGPDPRVDPVVVRAVTPGYFRTMGIPLRAGRALEADDRADGARVGVINEAFEREHWSDRTAVGTRISLEDQGGDPGWIEIVGVVGDVRNQGLDVPPDPAIYIPYSQKWSWMSWMTIVARVDGNGLDMVPAIRAAVRDLDAGLPVLRATSMNDLYAESHARRRFAANLASAFAALALVLAAVGVYGVVSYSVNRRRREFGIRMACGARVRALAAAVVGEGVWMALVGVAGGTLAAVLLTRLLSGFLFEVSPVDPITFGAVALLLLAVAMLASWIPARRAMRLEPMNVLREE